MVSLETPLCDFNIPAFDFTLLGVDGHYWTLQDCMGENGLLIMFICNHCPYVKAIQQRLIRDTLDLKAIGINSVAIMSNDTTAYPEDSFENMQSLAHQLNLPFPYLWDETQSVAKHYGAVCTPDFFGYNKQYQLQYRGRLDASRKETAPEGTPRDLFEAMSLVARTGKGPQTQIPSIGCSIKWKPS
jgi:peroxiredoxin